MKVLFNDNEVQKLLDDYQKLIGIRIAVFDTNFNELYSSPKDMSKFCKIMRSNSEVENTCKYCDNKAFRQAKVNKDTYIYQCHLGLYEAVTPIYDNHQILGYVMIGQVLGPTDKNHQWINLCRKYPKIVKSFNNAKTHFLQLKQMTIREIEAVSRIMKACASYIWLQHIIEIERSPIANRIAEYINSNYAQSINTKQICKDLNLSKTTIYNYLKEEYNLSLCQYINHIRLEKAKELLLSGNTPIVEIAHRIGFDDYNYFSRLFKNKYGISPTKYRAKYNNLQ